MPTVTVNADAAFPTGPHVLSVVADVSMLDEAGAVIGTTTLPTFVAGVQASVPIVLTGSPPVTLAMTAGSLPAGMALVGASISGTPSTPGSGSVTLTATNAFGSSVPQILSWTVAAGAAAPFITTSALPAGTVDAAYSFTPVATGTGPFVWTAVNLPPGLSINPSTGAITGTPTVSLSRIVTITATSATYGGSTVSLPLSINSVASESAVGGWARFLGK